jgi:uncharacterized oligopeptide transporter (OPT) family protein
MSPSAIGSKYTRYIGAGAIATGGLITIVKIMPTVFVSIKKTLSNISVTTSDNYDPDLSLKLAIAMAIFSFVVVAIIPGQLFVGLIGDLRRFDNKIGIGIGLNYKKQKEAYILNFTTNQISLGLYKKLF